MTHPDETDRFELRRFVEAQDEGDTYGRALDELRQGRKRSHWMWFVFPQLAGLGHSAMARRYAVSGLPEARAYLAHEVLGPRLLECTHALLALDASDAVSVLGSVDAQKLRSSMTLFATADPARPEFQRTIDRYLAGQPDPVTLRALG